MKNKIFLCLTLILSFFVFKTNIIANTFSIDYTDFISDNPLNNGTGYLFNYNGTFVLYEEQFNYIYYALKEEYINNYSLAFPYYSISFSFYKSDNDNIIVDGRLAFSDNLLTLDCVNDYFYISDYSSLTGIRYIQMAYGLNGNVYSSVSFSNGGAGSGVVTLFQPVNNVVSYFPTCYYESNFDLINTTGHTLIVNNYNNTTLTISPGDIIQPYSSLVGNNTPNYTEINLSNYQNLYLTLNDYTYVENLMSDFMYKGALDYQFVANYGRDTISYAGVDVEFSSDYSLATFDLTDEDYFTHNYVIILTANSLYDTWVKIDTNIFNIHYINFNETYPTITLPNDTIINLTPPNNLLIDGYQNTILEDNFDDFSTFLAFVKDSFLDLISSIGEIFKLFFSFLGLLPPIYQSALYLIFSIGIILGIIKIIL